MNLQKINKYIEQYIRRLEDPNYDGLVLWELVHQFQSHWDLDASSFEEMFGCSFGINSPLWNKDDYIPKKMMERYIRMNDDLARAMFYDLFNESKDITGRISRFVFQCDEFYNMDRSSNQRVLPHYHSDMKMIFLYLAFRYPEKYSLYDFSSFKNFMQNVGSTKFFSPQDLERFVKVTKTISMLTQKNEHLIELISSKISPITNDKIFPMLLVYEIYSMDYTTS